MTKPRQRAARHGGDRVPPRWIASMREMIRGRGPDRRDSGAKPPRRFAFPPRGSRPGRESPDALRKTLAWGVHLYTAMGLVASAAIAVLIVRGTPEAFVWAFVLMAVATFIDATDGTFARKVKVKEVTPGFDGRRLDDLVDFLTYTCLPLFLIWRAGILPESWSPWLLVPLLASAYGFCQVSIKTDDGYFLGFPSYWNLVAFYLYALEPAPEASLAILLGLALLTFVPIRYLYPSQPGRLNRLTVVLGLPWTLLLGVILWAMSPRGPFDAEMVRNLTIVSLLYPAYYMIASFAVSYKLWLARTRAARSSS